MHEDRALLKRWREGDGKAGEELFRRHFADVFRFFDSKVSAHAEDLTQQTFIACLKSPEGLSREPDFRCFLFAIAWTALQRHLSGELNNEPVDFEVSSLNDITGRIGSPSSQLHRAQQSQFVHQALARLPAKQQILLEYCYWHNLDEAALADIFGVDADTIPDLLLRARNALRAQLTGTSPRLQTAESADALTNSLLQHEDEDRGGVDSVDEKGKAR